jgi:hypothetical protein
MKERGTQHGRNLKTPAPALIASSTCSLFTMLDLFSQIHLFSDLWLIHLKYNSPFELVLDADSE